MNPEKLLLCLSTLALASVAYGEPSVTVQNKDYVAGSSVNEWAQYTIDTSGNVIVRNNANVSFSAGSRIALYPGFKVESGGTFNATVSYNPAFNPGGYYNAITPTLALIAGNQQYGQVNQFNLQPFDIAIWNTAGTAPLVNAPVLITVNSGGGWISTTNGGTAVLKKTLQLTTDADGTVRIYYKQGSMELIMSSIQVIAGGQNWEFTTFSYTTTGANADTDGDGIINTLETSLGTNPLQPVQLSSLLGLQVLTP